MPPGRGIGRSARRSLKETDVRKPPGKHHRLSSSPGRHVPAWLVLGIVCIGQFMVVLDASIVNVALPSIQRDLHFSTSGLQWIVNAYTLTFAGFLLLGGRAADLFGRRKIFLLGLTVFTVSSLLGGLAQNEAWLISARAVQGLGAAILAPATLTILTATFAEGPARAWALGAWSAVSSAGASAGALLGGILTDLLELALDPLRQRAGRRRCALRRPARPPRVESRHGAPSPRPRRCDHGDGRPRRPRLRARADGDLLVGLGAGPGAACGWPSCSWPRSSSSRRRSRRPRWSHCASSGPAPLPAATSVMLMMFGALFGSWYFETLYMQHVLGYSPLQAGLAFLPQTLLIAAGAQVTRAWCPGSARVLSSCSAPGGRWRAGLAGPDLDEQQIPGRPVRAVRPHRAGHGPGRDADRRRRDGGVAREEAGLASGLLNTSRTVGAAIGLAALATVAANRTTKVLTGTAGDAGPHGGGAHRRVRALLHRGRRAPRGHGGRRAWSPCPPWAALAVTPAVPAGTTRSNRLRPARAPSPSKGSPKLPEPLSCGGAGSQLPWR